MKKYAFIVNAPGLSVEGYMDSFDDGEWISHIAGLDGIEACMDYGKKLIADGYELINLCGDFGAEHVAELMKAAPEGTEVHYAAYLPEEQKKLEALSKFDDYGIIIFGGVEEPLHIELIAPEMKTHAIFVKDMDQAGEAARELAAAGVDGIELCSGFDEDMTRRIIEEVCKANPKTPVGSNGLG